MFCRGLSRCDRTLVDRWRKATLCRDAGSARHGRHRSNHRSERSRPSHAEHYRPHPWSGSVGNGTLTTTVTYGDTTASAAASTAYVDNIQLAAGTILFGHGRVSQAALDEYYDREARLVAPVTTPAVAPDGR
jgi:hypothetical protein